MPRQPAVPPRPASRLPWPPQRHTHEAVLVVSRVSTHLAQEGCAEGRRQRKALAAGHGFERGTFFSAEPTPPGFAGDERWCPLGTSVAAERTPATVIASSRLAAAGVGPVAQIDCWEANGGVTYQDPDGRELLSASWIYGPPRS